MHMRSKKKDIESLLEELQGLLCAPDFDIDQQYFLIRTHKEDKKYSTPFTLLDLEYDDEDVIETLKNLTIEEYSHTLFDRDNDNPPLLYVFGKIIQGRLVYIKFKLRTLDEGKGVIICISFHYAKEPLEFSYRK